MKKKSKAFEFDFEHSDSFLRMFGAEGSNIA